LLGGFGLIIGDDGKQQKWKFMTRYLFVIILDLFSWLIEIIREFVINSSEFLAHNTSRNMFNVVIMPVLLVGLFPIYIFLLLIPKISTQNNS